jgi:serine/threonine-protein kinase
MQIEVLGERYQLQDPIGRGGMATIYRGRDLRMDRVVAIKVLREVYSTDPKFVTRFQREAKAASSLQHPNIVQVFDYGQSDGNYFIVMELIEGTDLRRYLRSRGVLAVDRAIIIAHDVALGLGAAHRRAIVHRDVKPQNILVGRDGSIKLTDFGIASVYKDINAERLTTTGMTLGTVQYYAPEQAQGEIVRPAADVYALGIVMYEMLTGRTPFDGDTPVAVAMQHIQDPPTPPRRINPNIPPALEEIILRCLEKVPEMRFRDGSVLARALEMLGEDETGVVLPSAARGPITPPPPLPASIYNQTTPPLDGSMYPPQTVSSPDHGMSIYPYSPNDAQDNMPTLIREQRPVSHGQGMMVDVQPGPAPIGTDGATRPFHKGAMAQMGLVHDARESRFASIITILILLATLLLLGFSIYLASELGFLNFGGQQTQSLSTPTAGKMMQIVEVPDLRGKNLADAQQAAEKVGLKVTKHNGPDDGVVEKQSLAPQSKVREGETIQVDMKAVIKVPEGLAGNTLDEVKKILDQAHIKYSIAADGFNVNSLPNLVTRTDPPSGGVLQDGQEMTVFVVNYGSFPSTEVPPTAILPPSPTAMPMPTVTPTSVPSPVPSPSPSPVPSPSPSPAPSVSATAGKSSMVPAAPSSMSGA